MLQSPCLCGTCAADGPSAAQHSSSQPSEGAAGASVPPAADTGTETDDGLADLADDPELVSYLQVYYHIHGDSIYGLWAPVG